MYGLIVLIEPICSGKIGSRYQYICTFLISLMLSVHAHEGYCSLCLCVTFTYLAPAYDVCATN